MKKTKKYLNASNAARYCGTEKRTILQAAANGYLEHHCSRKNEILFHIDDLQVFIAKHNTFLIRSKRVRYASSVISIAF